MRTRLLFQITRVVLRVYALLMFRMDIHWHEALPRGPVLFAANHPSTTDPVLIHLISRRPISVMITSKVFSIPLLGPFMRRMKQISVIPGQGEQVLEEARQTLADGQDVAIFPEGLISPQDGFHAPRSGVARLALKSGVPVVPLGIYLREKGCRRIATTLEGEPDIVTWYLYGPYAVTIGKPLHFRGDAGDKSQVRQVADNIMENIRSLALESRRRTAE